MDNKSAPVVNFASKTKYAGLIVASSFFLSANTASAESLTFDGSLTIYDTAGQVAFNYPMYTGRIEFNTLTQTGTANFEPVLFRASELLVHDVAITQVNGILHVEALWSWASNVDQFITWDWGLEALPGFETALTVLDTDNDGTPGTALVGGPFPGFTMAIEGITSPVPVPAAVWLFGSGLLGLLSVARRRSSNA